MKRFHYFSALLGVCAALTLASCKDELTPAVPTDNGSELVIPKDAIVLDEGGDALLSFCVGDNAEAEVTTKSSFKGDTEALNDCYSFIFSKPKGAEDSEFTFKEALKCQLNVLSFLVIDSGCDYAFYTLGNCEAATTALRNRGEALTIAELESLSITLPKLEDAQEDKDGLAAAGYLLLDNVESGYNIITLKLFRLYAKQYIYFKRQDGMKDNKAHVSAITIHNAAKSVRPFRKNADNGNLESKIESANDCTDGDYASANDITLLASDNDGDKGVEIVFYIPENMQGVMDDCPNKGRDSLHRVAPDKYLPNKDGHNGSTTNSLCTYWEAKISFDQPVAVSGELTFKQYVGLNKFDNFSVKRGHNYSTWLTVTPNGIWEDDTWQRVDDTQFESDLCSGSNVEVTVGSETNYSFTVDTKLLELMNSIDMSTGVISGGRLFDCELGLIDNEGNRVDAYTDQSGVKHEGCASFGPIQCSIPRSLSCSLTGITKTNGTAYTPQLYYRGRKVSNFGSGSVKVIEIPTLVVHGEIVQGIRKTGEMYLGEVMQLKLTCEDPTVDLTNATLACANGSTNYLRFGTITSASTSTTTKVAYYLVVNSSEIGYEDGLVDLILDYLDVNPSEVYDMIHNGRISGFASREDALACANMINECDGWSVSMRGEQVVVPSGTGPFLCDITAINVGANAKSITINGTDMLGVSITTKKPSMTWQANSFTCPECHRTVANQTQMSTADMVCSQCGAHYTINFSASPTITSVINGTNGTKDLYLGYIENNTWHYLLPNAAQYGFDRSVYSNYSKAVTCDDSDGNNVTSDVSAKSSLSFYSAVTEPFAKSITHLTIEFEQNALSDGYSRAYGSGVTFTENYIFSQNYTPNMIGSPRINIKVGILPITINHSVYMRLNNTYMENGYLYWNWTESRNRLMPLSKPTRSSSSSGTQCFNKLPITGTETFDISNRSRITIKIEEINYWIGTARAEENWPGNGTNSYCQDYASRRKISDNVSALIKNRYTSYESTAFRNTGGNMPYYVTGVEAKAVAYSPSGNIYMADDGCEQIIFNPCIGIPQLFITMDSPLCDHMTSYVAVTDINGNILNYTLNDDLNLNNIAFVDGDGVDANVFCSYSGIEKITNKTTLTSMTNYQYFIDHANGNRVYAIEHNILGDN